MQAGISTACFYPQYTEDALHILANTKQPPDCVEVFFNAAAELRPAFLRELKKTADGAGIQIRSIHPYTSGMEPMYFFSHYDRRFQEGLDIYRRYCEAANRLGAGIVVFHGAMRTYDIVYERYFERFARIWELAKHSGVDLCHENVERCTSFCTNFFAELGRCLPEVGYVLDIKQAVRAGQDVMEFVEVMDSRIRHIHISDHSPQNDCLVPGKGVFNIEKFLNAVRKNGFDGSVIVELYAHNYESNVELFEGYRQLCTILSTVCESA